MVWILTPHWRGDSQSNFEHLKIESSKLLAVSEPLRFKKHFSSLDTSMQLMDISSSELGGKTVHQIE